MTPKDECPKSEGVRYATGEEWRRITRMKELGQSEYNAQCGCVW